MHAIVGRHSRDSGSLDKVQSIEAEVARLSSLVRQLMSQGGVNIDAAELRAEASPLVSACSAAPAPVSFDRARARMVRRVIRERRKRERFFQSHLLADPGWDMLLDLYAAHYEGQSVSVSSLCIAAAVPATTALRWIRTMEEEGHFVRMADPADRRRIFIGLTAEARARLDLYFDEMED